MLSQSRSFINLINTQSIRQLLALRTYFQNTVKNPVQVIEKKNKFKKKADEKKRLYDQISDFSKNRHEGLVDLELNENLEPDLNKLKNFSKIYAAEKRFNKLKSAESRTTRNHFSQFIQRDINLLSFAEKELIRFLAESDPELWTPAHISNSFPISADGAARLLKSPKFKYRTEEDVRRHDAVVQETLEKIKKGEIELNDDLKNKLKIRTSVPFRPGLISTPETGIFTVEQKTNAQKGPFASIVSPPTNENGEKNENLSQSASSRVDLNLNSENNGKRALENYDTQILPHSGKFLTQNSHMTLDEFEKMMRRDRDEIGKKISGADVDKMNYLLNYNSSSNNGVKNKIIDKNRENIGEIHKIDELMGNYTIESGLVEKYKKNNEEDEKIQVENNSQSYKKIPARIEVPKGVKKEGNTYQVGKSFYDENGEFIYRIV